MLPSMRRRIEQNLPLRDQNRLRCLTMATYADAWLRCLPSEIDGTAISSVEFRLLVKYRLGVPLIPDGMAEQFRCSACSLSLDIYADHYLTCQHSGFWRRHNAIRDLLQRELESHGIRVQPEKSIGGRERPADLWIPVWDQGQPACVDVTVVHAEHHRGQEPIKPAERAEANKRQHYAHLFPSTGAGQSYVPVAFTTWGQPGPSAKNFLYVLGKKAKRTELSSPGDTDEDEDVAVEEGSLNDTEDRPNPFTTALSVAIACQVARQLTASLPMLEEYLEEARRRRAEEECHLVDGASSYPEDADTADDADGEGDADLIADPVGVAAAATAATAPTAAAAVAAATDTGAAAAAATTNTNHTNNNPKGEEGKTTPPPRHQNTSGSERSDTDAVSSPRVLVPSEAE